MATDQVTAAFAKSLGLPESDITEHLAYGSIKEWDSTAHMVLIAELEDVFDVMLDTDDIIDMSSVAKAREILRKYDIKC
ncbi:MAG: acyl carrier protein [Idiomarina sp.]|nr:acyl carrier protein [Idiomarina sp.]